MYGGIALIHLKTLNQIPQPQIVSYGLKKKYVTNRNFMILYFHREVSANGRLLWSYKIFPMFPFS